MAERVVGQGSFGIVFQVQTVYILQMMTTISQGILYAKSLGYIYKILLFLCITCLADDLQVQICYWFGNLQAKCLETGETVAIKKVLQDKRYKNRELQTIRLLDHPNVVSLRHCFFSTTEKDELYLNLVLEYVPETVYRVLRHYSKANQRMPMIYVKLYTYQVFHFKLKANSCSVAKLMWRLTWCSLFWIIFDVLAAQDC